jgi:hypothetical protein
MGGGLHNTLTYETVYHQLSKQITPKVVLKNHNKSQKNHKMENLIVLNFE